MNRISTNLFSLVPNVLNAIGYHTSERENWLNLFASHLC